jgi:hypothetical protein
MKCVQRIQDKINLYINNQNYSPMKKILCSLLTAISFSAIVNAQTDKGDWMVGGGLSLNTTEGSKSFSFAPNLGHFFIKGLAGGAEMQIITNTYGETRNTTLGAGPFVRYYFELKEPTFKPLLHAAFNVLSIRSKNPGSTITETGRNFIIGGGGAFFINSNVAIDALLAYNHTKVENVSGNGGLLFRLGFQIHLLRDEVGIKTNN